MSNFDSLLDFAAVQFTVRDLLDKGEITEAEAEWYRQGWIPATAVGDADV